MSHFINKVHAGVGVLLYLCEDMRVRLIFRDRRTRSIGAVVRNVSFLMAKDSEVRGFVA